MQGIIRSEHRTASVGQPENTDSDRRSNSVWRPGIVKAVDYRRAVARVLMQEDQTYTDWIPWQTGFASMDPMPYGGDMLWWAPEPEDVVMVGSLSGELDRAFIASCSFSHGRRPAARPTVKKIQFKDHSYIEYDREAHQLKIHVRAQDAGIPDESDASENDAALGPIRDTPEPTAGNLTVFIEGNCHIESRGVMTLIGHGHIHLNPGDNFIDAEPDGFPLMKTIPEIERINFDPPPNRPQRSSGTAPPSIPFGS